MAGVLQLQAFLWISSFWSYTILLLSLCLRCQTAKLLMWIGQLQQTRRQRCQF
jgi:hypothetical protein